jgi:hypothetical protein
MFRDMSNKIKFEDGSSIEWVDRETLRYADEIHSALIWVDFSPGWFSRGRILKAASITRWESCPADRSKEISGEEKKQIFEKVQEYYKRQMVKCTIE